MKFALCSDLHLEFEPIELRNTERADVLLLAGDICIAEDLRRHPLDLDLDTVTKHTSHRALNADKYRRFFDQVSQEFEHVLYVPGNHEYYDGSFPEAGQCLAKSLSTFTNVSVMNLDTKIYDSTWVIAGTMWTDCNNGDPMTDLALRSGMSDFRVVRMASQSYRKLRPADVVNEFRRTRSYILSTLQAARQAGAKNVVVMTHHAPTMLSIADHYKHDMLSGGYASDLSDLILDHAEIKFWVHGHTHNESDYTVGDTRVLCNPRGYPGERSFNLKYFDLP